MAERMVKVSCPTCDARVSGATAALGKLVKCPRCGKAFVLSESGAMQSSAPQPAPQRDEERIPWASEAAVKEPETKNCPMCGEAVKPEAKRCKHCGETIDIALRASEEAKREAK
jgi:transposase